MRLFKSPLRVLAVMGKEVVEVLRRPRALLSIVAGPVLILGLFGLGYIGQPPLRAELVIPPNVGLSADPERYASVAAGRISIAGITADPAEGRAVLGRHEADLLVIVPEDAKDRLSQGQQAALTVEYDAVSPYRAFVARTAADAIVSGVNREIITGAARRPPTAPPPPASRSPSRPRSRAPPPAPTSSTSRRPRRTSLRSTGSWCWP